MTKIRPCPLPADALLARYSSAGAYTDCYTTAIDRSVSQAEYIQAFYTGGFMKTERLLLKLFLSRPSTDAEARLLGTGEINGFSVWRVEGRTANQLLLCDISGRTRSWLMVMPAVIELKPATSLYFGSAVVPAKSGSNGKRGIGLVFTALLGFHKLYSRVLLVSARNDLVRGRR